MFFFYRLLFNINRRLNRKSSSEYIFYTVATHDIGERYEVVMAFRRKDGQKLNLIDEDNEIIDKITVVTHPNLFANRFAEKYG